MGNLSPNPNMEEVSKLLLSLRGKSESDILLLFNHHELLRTQATRVASLSPLLSLSEE